jgi:hypothetical protein
MLSGFTPESLVGFLNILELPSLEDYCYVTRDNIAVDGVTSLLNRSGSRLKCLKLRIRCEQAASAGDLKELLNAVPHLQTLKLEIYGSHPGSFAIVSDLLQALSSSPPTLVGGIPGFLPHLQSLNLSFIFRGGSIWGDIPHIYSWPHRKILSLEVNTNIEQGIEVDPLAKILRLIDEGLDIRILHHGEHYLQKFKQTSIWMCTSLGLRLKQKMQLRRMKRRRDEEKKMALFALFSPSHQA